MYIIRDTREKEPWDFSFFPGVYQETSGLKTGDYTMAGYEEILFCERKRSTGEVAINLGKKWKTFEKELERSRTFHYKYIVCEFPESLFDHFPECSGIPEYLWKKIRINGAYLKSKLYKISDQYDIELIFSSNKEDAERKVFELFKNIKNENE